MAFPIALVPLIGTDALLYALVLVLAFSNSVASPALTGMTSRLADPTEQGMILGAVQAFSALGRFTGPFVFGEMYDAISPRATFGMSGLVMLVAGVVAMRVKETERR
jgi:predicted MFS family arabinose efflux permease